MGIEDLLRTNRFETTHRPCQPPGVDGIPDLEPAQVRLDILDAPGLGDVDALADALTHLREPLLPVLQDLQDFGGVLVGLRCLDVLDDVFERTHHLARAVITLTLGCPGHEGVHMLLERLEMDVALLLAPRTLEE